MSFVYPRTCDLHRPRSSGGTTASPTFGVTSYSGVEPTTTAGAAGEDVIATAIPCSIQAKATGRSSNVGGLPADSAGPVHWRFYIPASALAKGELRNRDILIDDLGNRFQVGADYWTPLGYQVDAVRLEV